MRPYSNWRGLREVAMCTIGLDGVQADLGSPSRMKKSFLTVYCASTYSQSKRTGSYILLTKKISLTRL